LKNLLLNSIVLILLSGCSIQLYDTLQKSSGTDSQQKKVVPWFSAGRDRYLLNTSITIYRNRFSGIMIIRPYTDNHYRVVFITEMGLKIFDMEFPDSGNIIVHYCIESLNRKTIMKTLQNDIGLMLNWMGNGKKMTELTDKKSGITVLKHKKKNKKAFFYIDKETGKTSKIIQTGITIKKVNLLYYKNQQNTIDSININHYNLKLNIHLSPINETKSSVSE
jgi:hypothetical protein